MISAIAQFEQIAATNREDDDYETSDGRTNEDVLEAFEAVLLQFAAQNAGQLPGGAKSGGASSGQGQGQSQGQSQGASTFDPLSMLTKGLTGPSGAANPLNLLTGGLSGGISSVLGNVGGEQGVTVGNSSKLALHLGTGNMIGALGDAANMLGLAPGLSFVMRPLAEIEKTVERVATEAVVDVAKGVETVVGGVANGVGSVVGTVAKGVGDAIGGVANGIGSFFKGIFG